MPIRGMKRRDFVAALGGAAAWPVVARAQQPNRMPLVGGLIGLSQSDPEGRAWIAAFEQGLADLGWTPGLNLRLSYRFTEGILENIQGSAKELIELRPDVILAGNTPTVAALMRETRTIPIIFTNLSDPLDTGLVTDLARPGGNVTGFTAYVYSMAGKWLDILKQAVPHITRAVLMFHPDTAPFAPKYFAVFQAAGTVLE